MLLNVKKLDELLIADERSIAWLARQIGVEPRVMRDRRKNKSVKGITKIADVLKTKPEKLIIWEE